MALRDRQTITSTVERSFVRGALGDQQRADGRRPVDQRTLRIQFPAGDGTAEVLIGKTRVLGVVTCELGAPFPDRASEGVLTINVEFSPMADPSFDARRPSAAAVDVTRIVERAVRESKAVDTEALCVLAGQKVWHCKCDVLVMDHDGSLADAAVLAAMAALRHAKRPDVAVVGTTMEVMSVEQRDFVPLTLTHIPVSITFGFLNLGGEAALIVDPTLQEEAVMDGAMTMVMNSSRQICAAHKAGGLPLDGDMVMQATQLAFQRVIEITDKLQAAIDADAAARTKRRG